MSSALLEDERLDEREDEREDDTHMYVNSAAHASDWP